MTDLKTTIRRLSKPQREAFDRICLGSDGSFCNRLVLKALERRGLIKTFLDGRCMKEPMAYRAWEDLRREARQSNLCHDCRAEMLLIENRRICPNGHGKSVLVGMRGRDLEKAERKRVEIVPADLTRVPLAGFRK